MSTETTIATTTIKCFATGETKETGLTQQGEPKLPRGWKRIGGKIYSPDGVRANFSVRSLWMPVVSTVVGYEPEWSIPNCDKGRAEVKAAIRASSKDCAMAANWAMRELAKSDNEPLEIVERGFKLPKWSPSNVDIYGPGRAFFPKLDSQSFSSLLQMVRSKYNQFRFKMRVLNEVSLPSYQKGIPVPVPSKDYCLISDPEQKQLFCQFRMHGQRFTSRLRTTPDRKHHSTFYQANLLRKICDEDYGELGELKVKIDKEGTIIMFFSVYLPIEKADREDRTMVVRTQPDRLLIALVEGREQTWNLNDDQVRKIFTAHKAKLKRLSEDSKFERRSHRNSRHTTPQAYRDILVRTYHRRVSDYTHKVSSMIVGLAVRNKCALVKYDYRDKSWCVEFPWRILRDRIEQKLTQKGIRLEVAEGSDNETQGEQDGDQQKE